VLWFEHDLFCQVQLIICCTGLRSRPRETKLTLICIDEFPGVQIFPRPGPVECRTVALHFCPERHEITTAQLELAAKAWAAYCAPDALALIALLKSDMSAMPFLKERCRNICRGFLPRHNGLAAWKMRRSS